MPYRIPLARLKLLLLTTSLCVATTTAAAPPGADYRLSVVPAEVRLGTETAALSVPERPRESGTASRLASMPFAKLIEGAAREASLDPALVHAVIAVESGYNPAARSPKGALGLMQVLPATALRYGIRNAARSPAANLRAGTLYLSELMQIFDHRLDLVLAAYNAGEAAVLRYGLRIPPFRETQQYVPAVLARYLQWREPAPAAAGSRAVVIPPRFRIQYMPGTILQSDALSGLAVAD